MKKINRALWSIPRRAASHIPREVSARTLATNPKLSGRQRRHFQQARELEIELPRAEAKGEQEVFCRKLKALPLEKLLRRATQSKNRGRKAAKILATLGPKSRFRPPMEQEVARQLYRLSWVENEVNLRLASKPKKAKECADLPNAFEVSAEQMEAMKAQIRKASPEEVALYEQA